MGKGAPGSSLHAFTLVHIPSAESRHTAPCHISGVRGYPLPTVVGDPPKSHDEGCGHVIVIQGAH